MQIRIIKTNDTRPWTQPKARNIGAANARGNTLLFTDIDHVIDKEAIEFGRNFKYEYGRFKRELAVLDANGNLTQDRDVLAEWGIVPTRGLHISCHVLSMFIKADVFNQIEGFREKIGKHPTHDDGNMKRKLNKGNFTKCPDNERPKIYVIPNGRFIGGKDANPYGYFHDLCR